jgi:TPR repeat protein
MIIRRLSGFCARWPNRATLRPSLGLLYELGWGVPQDYAEESKWVRRAAEQGNAQNQLVLGAMYDEGKGVPQDYAETPKWYRSAAEHGISRASIST